MAASAVVAAMIAMPALASAQSVGDVQSQIQALMNQLRQLQAQLIQLTGGATTTMMWHGDSDASSTRAMMGGDHGMMGGGDTAAAIEGSGISLETLGFVSTGGGAMLDYLLHGTLPGIEALT